MRTLWIPLVALAVIPFCPILAEGIAVRNEVHAAEEQAVEIQLLREPGWIATFRPDGRVHLQYGSSVGDAASQPKKSVHFNALVKAVERLKSDRHVDGASQVAVHGKGKSGATAFTLKDDTLFRYLFASFEGTWQPDLGGKRFEKLLRMYPVYDGDDAGSKDRP